VGRARGLQGEVVEHIGGHVVGPFDSPARVA
jgi:hypothetical protein